MANQRALNSRPPGVARQNSAPSGLMESAAKSRRGRGIGDCAQVLEHMPGARQPASRLAD